MGKKASERWAHASRLALDLLFPPRCAGCGDLGLTWCATCNAGVRHIEDPLCAHCGLPAGQAVRCAACANRHYKFNAGRSWGVYAGELRRAILSLKHRRNASLAAELAKGYKQVFEAQDWKVDLLIPIPLGPQRLKQRGYNQIELLAAPFGEFARLRYAQNVLIRRHDTLPQFELNAVDRWENLHGSFVASPAHLVGKNVLVIDDIMTTGATLDSAAQALLEAGAKKVYAITLARTLAEADEA